ncbi:ureidoglycolate amidohydrolase, partial [Sarracenia purpurea var. burkii]
MSLSLSFAPLSLVPLLFLLCSLPEIIAREDGEDPITKTMEDFSGYTIQEPHFPNSLSSLSVDTQNLQKQYVYYLNWVLPERLNAGDVRRCYFDRDVGFA